MSIGKIANTVCLIKSLVCLENFNLRMNLPKKIKSEWMLTNSNQTTVEDKNNVSQYYDIIK